MEFLEKYFEYHGYTIHLFDNSLYQISVFIGACLLGFIGGKIITFCLKKVFKIIYKKKLKKSLNIEHIVIDSLAVPIQVLSLGVGFYIGSMELSLNTEFYFIYHSLAKNFITIAIGWFLISLNDSTIKNLFIPLAKKRYNDIDVSLVFIIQKTIKIVILFICIIIFIHNFGYDVTSLIASLGVGGLAVALAAQETIKHLFGGLSILLDRPFKVGDFIEVSDHLGEVVEIGLRSTRIRTPENKFITIPNDAVSNSSITNYSFYKERKLSFIIGLVYDTTRQNISLAKEIIEEIVEKHPNVLRDVEVKFTTFNDFSLDIYVGALTDAITPKEMREIKDEINLEIKIAFDQEKLSIAFPTQTIVLEK